MNVCDLGGRTALVTGAGQGVGLETALLFAQSGAGGIALNDLVASDASRWSTGQTIPVNGGASVNW